jgi:hypothetical protein
MKIADGALRSYCLEHIVHVIEDKEQSEFIAKHIYFVIQNINTK